VGRGTVGTKREGSIRERPHAGVGGRRGAGEVLRYHCPGEIPNEDTGRTPLHRIDPAVVAVETSSERIGIGTLYATPRVVGLIGIFYPTIHAFGDTAHFPGGALHGASARGMHADRVKHLIVDALDDVDLSVIWPVGTTSPKGGPVTTSKGHMREVKHKQTSIKGLLAGNANGRPPRWIKELGML